MDTVNAMRNLSPSSSASSDNAGGSSSRLGPQPFGKKSASPTFGSVSPSLSSDSHRGPPSHPAPPPALPNSSPTKKKSPPGGAGGQPVVAEPTTTTNTTPPGRIPGQPQPPPTSS